MKTIAIAAIKGGTGKTTTAAALAQAAAADGRKVLAVDLDAQANLTYVLGADRRERGSYDVLHGTPAASVIQETAQGIDTIAGSPKLSQEVTTEKSMNRLRPALKNVLSNYDLVIIDTPPHMGELTFNALQAADGVIITLSADVGSVQGFDYTLNIIHGMQQHKKGLQILGALVTRYDGRPRHNRAVLDKIRNDCAELGVPYLGEIRPGVAVQEAQLKKRNLFEYAPNSNPAADYKRVYSELLTK